MRPGCADDAPAVLAYRAHPDVGRYQGWIPTDLDDVRARWADTPPRPPLDAWWSGAIEVEGRLVGDVGVHLESAGPQAELGITLDPAHQGRGYAQEALRLTLGFVFETAGVHRVHCSVDPRNLPCLRLMQAVGMRQEAHHVESYWLRGEWVDDVIFALLRREWTARASD